MLFGLQMYGFSRDFNRDPEGFCKTLSEGGFKLIEPCLGFVEEVRKYGFWTPEDLLGHLPLLERYGLSMISAHIAVGDWETDLPILCETAAKAGLRQVVVKSPQELTAESLAGTAKAYRTAAEKLAEHGIALLIHNEARDIAAKVNGKTAFETLLDLCGPLVKGQADVGWVYAGGEDPEAFLWRNEGRIASLHYKDMDESRSETAPGTGAVDFAACFQFARANGCSQIIDMDRGTPDEAVAGVQKLASMVQIRDNTSSLLCTLDVDTGEEVLLHRFDNSIVEAPNWLSDGRTILYNSQGCIFRYDIETDAISKVDTGFCVHCNNDHVPSPDNRKLAVSCAPEEGSFLSNIYIIDLENPGRPRQLTPDGLSFLHGWSPDGKELCYCGFKFDADGTRRVEICKRDVETGEETILTKNAGFNDGPEYSPDGRHIWFISTRTGLMQVWRMDADGSNQVQMTDSEANNWFGHVSPDGRCVVYLTFTKGELEPHEHLSNMKVSLSIMNYDGSQNRKLLDFFGGQGSINVNSWSPDNKRIAFVKYELHHK